METVLQIILALIGLGILVFIHELGHYWVARRVGMTVEVFSIGFGKPIHTWMRKGVKWQVGWLPFGGYVKIAGMEISSNDKDPNKNDPYQIPDGYYGKKPIDRIKVALAGPLANLILAFLIFAGIWISGGREKPFAEFTQTIGWVDPNSELYAKGIRPGDSITEYNGHVMEGYKDLLYAAMFSDKPIDLVGNKWDSFTGKLTPFNYSVKPYQYPGALEGLLTVGVLSPAKYLIYNRLPNGKENALPEGSPMKKSGIQYGDQIVWANGDETFSLEQFSELINEPRAILTIQRGSETFLARVPRVRLEELKLDAVTRGELTDWQHEAALKAKFQQLYFIPYSLNAEAVVEGRFSFIDPEAMAKAFPATLRSQTLDKALQPGDKILAIDGLPFTHSYQLLNQLQQQRVQLIVLRGHTVNSSDSWEIADDQYTQEMQARNIQAIASSIGTPNQIKQSGDYVLLNPVVPKAQLDFALSPEQKAFLATDLMEKRKKIEGISDPEKRARALQALEESQNKLILGIALQDRDVNYNPPPYVLFGNVFDETWRTLLALVSGYLSPKWLSGPVGIVHVMQRGWDTGINEALFWIAAISVNLGLLNLLPLPILDGGHILFALFEILSGKRLKPKVLERLIIPFVLLLIGFIVFITYYDITRLF